MNQPKKITSILFLAAVIVFGGRFTFAQPETRIEPSYEAMLYVVLGTDDASQRGEELPKSISSISKQLRDNFTFQNYRLVNTYLGRLANTGSLEYKSVSNIHGAEQNIDTPSFLDWQLTGVRTGRDDAGRNLLQMQQFRFGARVPLRVATFSAESKATPVINYETVGLTLIRINLAENSPTLIGTISLPKTTGTVFLVLAIRPV